MAKTPRTRSSAKAKRIAYPKQPAGSLTLANVLRLEGSFEFLQRPGAWLWTLVGVGILVRAYLVLFTEGTYDITIYLSHAQGILKHGLLEQYRLSDLNHPPFACWIVADILRLSQWLNVPFGILLRAPFALADMGSAFLLGFILRKTRYRYAVIGLYAIHPLAMILSAFHGNTDSLVALLVLLSVALAAADRPIAAASALGISFWIKLPGILVAPALFFAFKQWRDRLIFGVTAALTGVLTYLPALLIDPMILYARVFSYPGLILQTPAGMPVWGPQSFLFLLQELPPNLGLILGSVIIWVFEHNRLTVLLPLMAFAWMRRGRQDAMGLGTTIAASYAIVYAFSNNWSFQYFAWSIPFWFLAGRLFLTGATLLAGGYIYALYAFLCGSPFLLGIWDFMVHPTWPRYLLALRNAAIIFFFITAVVFLVRASWEEWRVFRSKQSKI